MSYTKNDIYILRTISKAKALNELTGIPISTITKGSNLSPSKVRNTVKMLQLNELIKEGFMQRNAKTYYITKLGEELLKKLMSNNILE